MTVEVMPLGASEKDAAKSVKRASSFEARVANVRTDHIKHSGSLSRYFCTQAFSAIDVLEEFSLMQASWVPQPQLACT
jgi:hypothetical protein